MKLPDGPKTPRVLQAMQFVKDPLGYMDDAQEKYGDIFTSKAFTFHDQPTLMISNPEALKQILTNDTKEFSAPGNLMEIVIPFFGDYSLLVLDGDTHRQQRKLMMPSFHGDHLKAYGKAMCDITEKVMAQLSFDKPFVARTIMRDITLQSVIEVLFGFHEGERWERLMQLMLATMNHFQNPLWLATGFFPLLQKDFGRKSPWGYFVHMRQQIDDLIYEEIEERRAKPDPDARDLLTLLISARDEDGQPMTNKQLRDQMVTLMMVGHENSANAIAWALYWVHKHPEVLDKLLQELASLGDSPEPMAIVRAPYMSAVCNEILRLSSGNTLTSGRMVRSPVELMGYQLSPGIALFGSIYLTHNRPDLYPEPKQFKPERFLERQFSPYEFIPFGGGIRSCMGANLALMEIKLILATVVSRYQLALADDQPEKLVGRGVVLIPERGVKMVVKSPRIREEQKLTATVS
jgi:cytochrome P450 family 110